MAPRSLSLQADGFGVQHPDLACWGYDQSTPPDLSNFQIPEPSPSLRRCRTIESRPSCSTLMSPILTPKLIFEALLGEASSEGFFGYVLHRRQPRKVRHGLRERSLPSTQTTPDASPFPGRSHRQPMTRLATSVPNADFAERRSLSQTMFVLVDRPTFRQVTGSRASSDNDLLGRQHRLRLSASLNLDQPSRPSLAATKAAMTVQGR